MTPSTPRGSRTQIGLFGRRNAGKSSLLNALVRQQVSIVSAQAGTTTDPVEKPMELLPLGPVLFIDTAGLDDEGALGALRVARTRQVLDRVDLGLLVTEGDTWGACEERLLAELRARGVPAIEVAAKADLLPGPPARGLPVSARTGAGLDALREAVLAALSPECRAPPPLLSDLVPPGELALLVVPIDGEAPRGRLILPQVQAIRDLLDGDAMCLVVKERELGSALGRLARPPRLVVTDSQAFREVAAAVPPEVPLTSFSILLARQKGDLCRQVEGALAVDRLRDGDRVLVAEACTHHPIGEDIGRVKIPRWLAERTGARLRIDHCQGHDFPADLSEHRLVIHCGACMLNRREVVNRLRRCAAAGVPVTNYGLVIARCLGILERALGPFPAALEACRRAAAERPC